MHNLSWCKWQRQIRASKPASPKAAQSLLYSVGYHEPLWLYFYPSTQDIKALREHYATNHRRLHFVSRLTDLGPDLCNLLCRVGSPTQNPKLMSET